MNERGEEGANRPKRRPNRLPDYDYSRPGCYFVTACSKDKRHIFGTVVGGDVLIAPRVILSRTGKAVEQIVSTMPCVEKYVIMPNHIHLLLRIPARYGTAGKDGPMGTSAPTEGNRRAEIPNRGPSVPGLIRYLKRSVTRMVGQPVWQRSYHDHVVRNDADYLRIWSYIDTNPAKWREDCYFTETEE